METGNQRREKVLSLIIPIVIHHGDTTWEYKSMNSYFVDLPQILHKFIPEFDYLLFSLNDIEDDILASIKNVILSFSAMLLKHSHDENDDFLKLTPFWLEKLKELDTYSTTIGFYQKCVCLYPKRH